MRDAEPDRPQRLRWHRRWQGAGWGLVALVVVLSLAPSLPHSGIEQGDKLGHLAAYGLLMGWFAQLREGPRGRIACAAGFVALGIGLEFLQGLTGYRTFDVVDMAANAAGVLLGWLLAPPRGPRVFAWAERLAGPAR